jgi:hypothetical protein
VCTLSLTIIPIVEVRGADTEFPVLSQSGWRSQSFKRTDAYGWWRIFTSCSMHS